MLQAYPQNLIFTVCTGRCGQHSLGEYLTKYAFNTLAEVEPPNLIYPNHLPFGTALRNFQRKWVVPDEMLGRGRALDWYRNGDDEALMRLSMSRQRRIERLCKKHKQQNYFEISKFFIRSYYKATYEFVPNMGVLLLRRDPISNAKSFVNRNKKFTLDNQLPDEKNVILKMQPDHLSPFQHYLWQWCEVELRYLRFIKEKNINRHYVLNNHDLLDPKKISDMLDFFSIDHVDHETISPPQPVNTNVENGFEKTKVTRVDFNEFVAFIEMLPATTRDALSSLDYWRSEYKKLNFLSTHD